MHAGRERAATQLLRENRWDLSAAADAHFSGRGSAPTVDVAKVTRVFESYAGDGEEMLEDGIAAFCGDLRIDPQDVAILIIAWRMNAAEMCVFTKEEFIRGFQDLGCVRRSPPLAPPAG